ncbi:hypothetical protein Tco_0458280 [Tanacetum coccineum]
MLVLFDPTPSDWTAKLCNDILIFQQRQGESLSEAWTRFKDLLQKVPHHGIDLWLQVKIFYDHVNPAIRRTIDQSVDGKLHDRNAKESWALLEDLTLYDNKSWIDPRDFVKLVKAISLTQDVLYTFDHRLIELWSPGHSVRPWKRSSNSFVETDPCVMMKAGWHGVYFQILANNLGEFQNGKPEQDEQEEKDNPENIYTNPSSPPDPSVLCITKNVRKLNSFFKSIDLVPQSSDIKFVCLKGDDGDVMIIEIIKKYDDFTKEGQEDEGNTTIAESEVGYFDTFSTRSELAYHKLYLMRRSLEVLKKFHWMILGGRFNQLSHVSSPLLSKPGEY